jgi:PAS domain S-box-containing protein
MRPANKLKPACLFCLSLILVWTFIIAAIIAGTIAMNHRHTIQRAEGAARDFFKLNFYYRIWNARLGGIYVPTNKIPSNPFLDVPERDVTTSDGKHLTLITPAHMTRLVFEDIRKSDSNPIISKVTSLKPIYPGNMPDAWEQDALRAFESGAISERTQITDINDKPYLRLISKYVTELSCLKCHGVQGHRIGDIRGGISIAIPLNEYYAGEKKVRNYLLSGYLSLWILGCAGIFIFSRKRAYYEKELVEAQNIFRTVCDWTQDWEYWKDPAGKTLYASPSCKEITGYTPEEFMADELLEIRLVHPDDRERYNSHHVKALHEIHETEHLEFRIIRRDGVTRWIHHICRPVGYGEDNRGRRVSNRDITEQKLQAEERRHLELQMLQTQKLESLGVMAGGIAHDFNNILTSIVGNTDIALTKIPSDSAVTDNLRKVEAAAHHATELARQLLAYSGKGKFNIEPIDINQLIKNLVNLLQVSISKKATLQFKLGDNLPSVEGDATQLRQVIMNIVINASDAIGENSGEILITTGSIECDRSYLTEAWLQEEIGEGRYIYLEISDTGCGMDRETVKRIFDPFFTTKFTGRGLGMAAVLGIIKGHRGAIKVDSNKGLGTSFKILLPAGVQIKEAHNEYCIDQDWRGKGKVLLVDDEESVLAVGSEMLRLLGLVPITCPSGMEAIALFKNEKDVRCVILDLTMPEIDGEETSRELRKIDPGVKIIMSSGYNETEINQKFTGNTPAGFIQKPYKLSNLREVMQKVLQRSLA